MPKGPAVYILTSAQNNTRVHDELWRNLQAYAKHRGAQILVSQFAYNKAAYLRRDGAVKADSVSADDFDGLWYDERILPHRCNERLNLAKSLAFCGEVNILPTAVRPLSGFENYAERQSTIFPHAKQEMISVASTDNPKLIYSTGTVTLRNYLGKKAGFKAEYQHAYGALIVEVDKDGSWFVRQLRATEDGSFQDLDIIVSRGKVTAGARVEAIQWGDIHVAKLDPVVRELNWGKGGILDTLRPRYQFMHDTLDFLSRNHHEMRNPHEMFRKWAHGLESVEDELREVAGFLAEESLREDCQTVVVDSNHDQALTRWLRESEFRVDPANARFYLKAQRMMYDALAAGRENFNLLGTVLRHMGVPKSVRFLTGDEGFVICRAAGGIECGQHGDRGANGSRGSALAFARMGRRINVGHAHSASIVGDAFTAGVSGNLRMGYNSGASSWSHSHIVTYSNGCRAILTIWKGRYRAAMPS